MKISKRLLALTCALAMALALCSCGSSSDSDNSSSDAGPSYFEWPTSGLAVYLPEPTTNEGELDENSSSLIVKLTSTSLDDYQDYVSACKDKGFTIDVDEDDDSFNAFNQDGYKVNVNYDSSEQYYKIRLDKPKFEAGSTFDWPSTGLATMLPEPVSHVGRIEFDTSFAFSAYVGETSPDDYINYVNLCIEYGFTESNYRSEKYFWADNANGCSLNIDYEGYNMMYINLYTTSDYEEEEEGVSPDITDEGKNTVTDAIPESSEEVSTTVEAETPSEKQSAVENTPAEEASEPDVLTADNCPEFAEVLSCGDFSNQLYADFYDKYKGETIEFDGNIVLVEDDTYNGYYDVLICPGDYRENAAYGPQFRFDGAAPSYFEEGNKSMDLPAYVKVGANVHVVARLGNYDDFAGVCNLYPVSITER